MKQAAAPRYYLHGDRKEGSDLYYCKCGDVFARLSHFQRPPLLPSRGETHRAVLDWHARAAGRQLDHRPDGAENCISGPGRLAMGGTP